MNLVELDKRHHFHPYTSIPAHQADGSHIISRGEGIHVYDDAGKKYIDAMAGLWCVNVGYGRKEIADAVAEQIGKLSYYHSFMGLANEPTTRLSERLAKLAPGDLNRVFFCNSGSEANDTHVKLIWYYNNLLGRPQKKKIIARTGAYHGVTVASASLSGLTALHQYFDVPRPLFLHVSRPCYYWDAPAGLSEADYSAQLAAELDEMIQIEGPETVAAFFVEPVMGAGGVITPPKAYFEAIVPVLRKHDVLFVVDEVICGFGRLGRMFGSEYYGLQPDLMTVAKGLTSGYLPMSACLVSDRFFETLHNNSQDIPTFAHGYTYTGHPVAAAAALANLDIIEREGLVQNAAKSGAVLQAALEETVAKHPLVGEKRGIGLIAGVELVADKADKSPFPLSAGVARRMYKLLLDEGLVCRPILNTLAFSPPLIISESQVEDVVARFERALAKLASQLHADGTWRG